MFRELLKSLNFRWNNNHWNNNHWNNNHWEKAINELTGTSIDRASELVNKLLTNGFMVFVDNTEVRTRAIEGNFERECNRWILATSKTQFKIVSFDSLDLYKVTRYLGDWNKGARYVDINNFQQLEDFADIYNFQFTKKAKKLIEDYKAEYYRQLDNIEKVQVVEVDEIVEEDNLKEILSSSREIISDLIEED